MTHPENGVISIPMSVDLKFFAKPGQNGQVYISLDSMIEFLRDHSRASDGTHEHHRALRAVADLLEEERGKIKEHQKTIAEVFSTSGNDDAVGKGVRT